MRAGSAQFGVRVWSRPVIGLVLLGAVLVLLPAGAAHSLSVWQPVYDHDFPDPDVMVYDQAEYAYATTVGLTTAPWIDSVDSSYWLPGESDALPTLPGWAAWGYNWAPSIAEDASGQFVMWYTTRDAALEVQCLSRAVSGSPQGPFVDSSTGPAMCQTELGGSIDPEIFTAPGGASYLYWKSDGNAIGATPTLWGAPLDPNLEPSGAPRALLTSDQPWQGSVLEAPDMAYVNGGYYLFYSAANYQSPDSAIGYAGCSAPLGPCTDSPYNPVLTTSPGLSGPDSPDIFVAPNGQLLMAFGGWPHEVGYANGGYRAMYVASVSFASDGEPFFYPAPSTHVGPDISRLSGDDAVGTAITVSQSEFPSPLSAHCVVIARSDYFSDAVVGGPLAARFGGPLLVTPGAAIESSLDPRVTAEIERVLPPGATVYLLGGGYALSPVIDSQLQALGYVTKRVAGNSQFDTAVAVAQQMGNPSTVFEATGLSFADALSAVPAAIDVHAAILLTNGDVQSAATAAYLDDLRPPLRYAVGGPMAAAGADPAAVALYGQDALATSAAVASAFFPNAQSFGAASAETFDDALCGGVYMATIQRGPMLLVDQSAALSRPEGLYLRSIRQTVVSATVFGGPLAVGDDVVGQLEAAA